MNMSEKVGRVRRGLQRVNLSSHGRENFLPDNFCHDQKRIMTSSVTWSKRFEFFHSFFMYRFCLKVLSTLNNSSRLLPILLKKKNQNIIAIQKWEAFCESAFHYKFTSMPAKNKRKKPVKIAFAS